ncbi:MAG: heparinase II/III family protein, partial [bacterium]
MICNETCRKEHLKMQAIAHDPYCLMPEELPPHPRTLLTPARLARAKQNIRTTAWAKLACEHLLQSAAQPFAIPSPWSNPEDPKVDLALTHALKNALAALLTGETRYRDEARRVLCAVARACSGWSMPGWRVGSQQMAALAQDHLRFFALAYDTLAAVPLPPDEDALLRAVLTEKNQGLDACGHMFCSNYNSWNIVARLTVASALGDQRGIHDALYGCDRNGQWRYGLVHQIRHDLLADGMHWERTIGYHYYSLMALTEIADLAGHIGIDVWHLQLPALLANEGHDLHRDYGPDGLKSFQMFYDAPFYQMFVNRDFSLLHDSGLANFRGTWIWGVVYDLAYQAYRDPKYAWLINCMEQENPQRKEPGFPMQLQTWAGYYDFLRIESDTYPGNDFSLVPDQTIGVSGRHVRGCSLFAVHGSAVLRSDPEDPGAPGAYLFFGPHSAGHQAPAALHLDLHAGGRLRTDAALSDGYSDPLYPTWIRTTIAHNTVTVDGTSMYPYDRATDSIWEADIWHDRISDGVLEFFLPEPEFKAVRASNINVYPGVRLDRTVILTRAFALDVFRVISPVEHQYDWALHVMGTPQLPAGAVPADLGSGLGYRHFRNACEVAVTAAPLRLQWQLPTAQTSGLILPPGGARLFVAADPPPRKTGDLGELTPPPERSAVIVRAQASDTVFLSLWCFEACAAAPPELRVLASTPGGEIEL